MFKAFTPDEILDMKKTQRSHVVIWSGGTDSTLVLEYIAEIFGTSDKPVLAISFEHYQLGEIKMDRERDSRVQILQVLRDKGLHIEHHTTKIEGTLGCAQTFGGSPQGFLWATNSVFLAPDRSYVHFGYNYEDSIWMIGHEFEDAFYAGARLLNKDLIITYPIKQITKSEVIYQLVERGLYDFIWFCEHPSEYRPFDKCNECKPCTAHGMAMISLALDGYEWAFDKLHPSIRLSRKFVEDTKRLKEQTKITVDPIVSLEKDLEAFNRRSRGSVDDTKPDFEIVAKQPLEPIGGKLDVVDMALNMSKMHDPNTTFEFIYRTDKSGVIQSADQVINGERVPLPVENRDDRIIIRPIDQWTPKHDWPTLDRSEYVKVESKKE